MEGEVCGPDEAADGDGSGPDHAGLNLAPEAVVLVAFTSARTNPVPRGTSRALDFWHRWADPEFSHCVTFVKSASVDVWAELQVWHSGLVVDICTTEFLAAGVGWADLSAAYYVRFTHNLRPWRPHLGHSCVTIAKAALGLWAPLVWTPRQLHALLERLPEAERLV